MDYSENSDIYLLHGKKKKNNRFIYFNHYYYNCINSNNYLYNKYEI